MTRPKEELKKFWQYQYRIGGDNKPIALDTFRTTSSQQAALKQ